MTKQSRRNKIAERVISFSRQVSKPMRTKKVQHVPSHSLGSGIGPIPDFDGVLALARGSCVAWSLYQRSKVVAEGMITFRGVRGNPGARQAQVFASRMLGMDRAAVEHAYDHEQAKIAALIARQNPMCEGSVNPVDKWVGKVVDRDVWERKNFGDAPETT